MFKKYILRRFKYNNLPKPLNDLMLENIIYNATQNVVALKVANTLVISNEVSYLEYEDIYGLPSKVNAKIYKNMVVTTDFVLLYDGFDLRKDYEIVNYYKRMIATIDKAIMQYADASELICILTPKSSEEFDYLNKMFKNYKGVKINKLANHNAVKNIIDTKPIDFQSFNISINDMETLQRVKQTMERELLSRFGISDSVDKTHITNANIQTSNESDYLSDEIDFILRKQFIEKINEKFGYNISIERVFNFDYNQVNNMPQENIQV